MPFILHPQLNQDCLTIGHFSLCRILMMNDKQIPWFILVPKRTHIREVYELNEADQLQLLKESCCISKLLMAEYKGDKLNVAALGNIVPQLHIHHVVRHTHDIAWPNPVWGNYTIKPYAKDEQSHIIKKAQALFENTSIAFSKS